MKVFISHSHQNGSAALALYERLTHRGVQAWLDTRDLATGVDWKQQVAAAIEAAGAFVVLVGPGAEPDSPQRFDWEQITDRLRGLAQACIEPATESAGLRTTCPSSLDTPKAGFGS